MDNIREITLDDVQIVIKAMQEFSVDYVIFGGIALNIHNVPRGTEDIDMFIRNSEENINNFLKAFRTLPMFAEITDDELAELKLNNVFEYGVVKFGGDIELDVATTFGELTFDTLQAEIKIVGGIEIKVITLTQLISMKSNSFRQKDIEDLARLKQLGRKDVF